MKKGCRLRLPTTCGELISLALALMLLSGCGGATSRATRATVTQKQLVDQLVITLEAPAKPRLLAEENLIVTLTDAAGKPVEGAQVWLGLVMPTMQHSPNEPDAVSAGQGRYTIQALFTMAGNWDLEVHATVQGQEHIAIFHAPVA
jgi:nitrogen fixation protein FixH